VGTASKEDITLHYIILNVATFNM